MSSTRLVIVGVFLLVALFLIMGTSPPPGAPGSDPVQQPPAPKSVTVGTSNDGYVITSCTMSGGKIKCVNYLAKHDTNPSGMMMWRIIRAIGPVKFYVTGVDTSRSGVDSTMMK